MSGVSTGQCWECVKRRLVCDQTRPGCRKCCAKGIECPGYDHKPLRWMQPGQTRSKGTRSKTRLRVESTSISRCQTATDTPPATLQQVDGTSQSESTDSTPEPLKLIVSPTLKDNSTAALLFQGIEYHNANISADLVSTGISGSSNPFYVPPAYACYIQPGISQTLICSVLGHRILQTVPGFEEERKALVTTLRSHRGNALRYLADELSNKCSDDTLIATLSLLLCEIQHSISLNWWQHAEAAFIMLGIRGGAEDFLHSRPLLKPLFRLFVLVDVLGSTTSPCVYPKQARRQFEVLNHLESLMEDGLSTCIPCPAELLREVICINYQRSSAHSQVPIVSDGVESFSTTALDSLDNIMGFNPETWASRVSQRVSDIGLSIRDGELLSSPATWNWTRVARVYQNAIALYCISNCTEQPQPNKSLGKIFSGCRSILLEDLQTISADKDSHIRKLVGWPLAILGLTLDHDDNFSHKYVVSELKWTSPALGIASPLVAKRLLEKTWLKGARGRDARWEDLFDRPYIFGI